MTNRALHALSVWLLAHVTHEAPAAPVDADRMLGVIAALENGDLRKPGGIFCITGRVWDQNMPGYPFYLSATHVWAEKCARLHLKWVEAQLVRARRPVTPASLYLAWRFGVTGSLAKLAPWQRAHGERAQNIYDAKAKP